ncbi:DUF3566 domain-containing protein [Humibacillus xanthopallidus]|uniref:Transmembrane protein DUF3566 n=1 Tax=Humibacillus xanthopallidus TaxID=412689 RepID=A0A543H9V3_9MICO|nr:DUF3566 domain-containing protein [Humibacillus xanthopallidus]TQM55104.1 transmembrane protein DUF3566 [Humibacillus xanthopallidus]
MSTTSEGGSLGKTQWGSDPTGPITSSGSSSSSASTQAVSTSSSSGSNRSGGSAGSSTTYYGSNGASFDSGSQAAVGSGASAPNTSGADTGGTPLTRGAVTTQTAPTKKVAPAAAAARPAARKAKGPRRVRLAVARMDPWSVMKMSFLLSVALGIAGVILTAVLWMILSTMNVFSDIEGVLQSLQTTTSDPFSIKDYVGFGRVVSLSIVIGVIDVILMTAIATVMAFLYNICSALVGGVQLTLTDD